LVIVGFVPIPNGDLATANLDLDSAKLTMPIRDLCKGTERFVGDWLSDHALRARVASRLPALYNTFSMKAVPP
jgi:hypothetical protein